MDWPARLTVWVLCSSAHLELARLMLIGDPDTFAIECYHEPIPNEGRSVIGRMCVWASGKRLGDIDEPACMLNVTEVELSRVLAGLKSRSLSKSGQ